jgi:hypothetical protein
MKELMKRIRFLMTDRANLEKHTRIEGLRLCNFLNAEARFFHMG